MDRIRTAVIGTGFMGRVHLEALRRVETYREQGIQGSAGIKRGDYWIIIVVPLNSEFPIRRSDPTPPDGMHSFRKSVRGLTRFRCSTDGVRFQNRRQRRREVQALGDIIVERRRGGSGQPDHPKR